MAEVSKENLNNAVSSLFKTGTVPSVVYRDRPAGQSKSTIQPYYKERFALEMKSIIETVEQMGQDAIILYADYPDLSKLSVYLRVNQGFRFLVDNLDFDPPNRFRALKDKLKITREKAGIRISFTRLTTDKPLTAKKVIAKEDNLAWQDKLEEFLGNSKPGDTFEQNDLSLTQEQIDTLEISMSQLENFLCKISPTNIKILHVSSDI